MSANARGWTPEAIDREATRRARLEAHGTCPDLGSAIAYCWQSDLCDCSTSPPTPCELCGVSVWDMPAHERTRKHPKF